MIPMTFRQICHQYCQGSRTRWALSKRPQGSRVGRSWEIYGRSMGDLWKIYGKPMGIEWEIDGKKKTWDKPMYMEVSLVYPVNE